MRLLVLWTHLSGYMGACLGELASRPDVTVAVVHFPSSPSAPFDDEHLLDPVIERYCMDSGAQLDAVAERFSPTALLVCGWHIPHYVRLARKTQVIRVMTMDNTWRGTARQRVAGTIIGRRKVSWADLVFLPGARQAEFARRLGFTSPQILYGSYSADTCKVKRAAGEVQSAGFVFAGRLVKEKGVHDLASAYQQYRAEVRNPWELTIAGTGALAAELDGPGVRRVGFQTPDAMADLYRRSSAFVLPSYREPWGVVVHEAAAAGLPLILSTAVTAGDRFLQPGVNGWLVEPGDSAGIAQAMVRIHRASSGVMARMRTVSSNLSTAISPEIWADTLLAGIAER